MVPHPNFGFLTSLQGTRCDQDEFGCTHACSWLSPHADREKCTATKEEIGREGRCILRLRGGRGWCLVPGARRAGQQPRRALCAGRSDGPHCNSPRSGESFASLHRLEHRISPLLVHPSHCQLDGATISCLGDLGMLKGNCRCSWHALCSSSSGRRPFLRRLVGVNRGTRQLLDLSVSSRQRSIERFHRDAPQSSPTQDRLDSQRRRSRPQGGMAAGHDDSIAWSVLRFTRIRSPSQRPHPIKPRRVNPRKPTVPPSPTMLPHFHLPIPGRAMLLAYARPPILDISPSAGALT